MLGLGLGVQDLGFRIWGLGLDLGFSAQLSSGFPVVEPSEIPTFLCIT